MDGQASTFTAQAIGVLNETSFGASTSTLYNASKPMASYWSSPTINIGTTSTGYYCEICSAPTETSVASGVTNYFIGHWKTGATLTAPNFSYSVTEAGAELATSWTPSTIYSAAGTALPSCASGIKGMQAVVSDATSPTYMGAYTSGGGITTAVICSYNGTTYSWLTH
jgi:hypothetical protein